MERKALVLGLGELAVRFSEGWHEGIKIDALDIVLLNEAAEALAQPAQEPAIGDIRALKHRIHELEGEVIGYKRILDAQPAQEPVAWMVYTLDGASVCVTDNSADFTPEHRALPLYTAPPQRTWVELEGEEIRNLWEEATKPDRSTVTIVTSFARAIEAKLKEKNT